MANVHVYIEVEKGPSGAHPAKSSLEVLGEARRIASMLGATVNALVPTEAAQLENNIVSTLGYHGADVVVAMCGMGLERPTLYAPHGYAVAAACERLPPALVLVAATPGGRDLAPRLAARIGAAFSAESSIEQGFQGDLILSRAVYAGAFRRRLSATATERPIVATLTPGSCRLSRGHDQPSLMMLALDGEPPVLFEEVDQKADSARALESAQIVVAAGGGIDAETWPLVCELARLIGAEIAVTRAALQKGLGSRENEVGIAGRMVSARLYIACGASGSAAHLTAISPGTEVVAINTDPHAPIFRVASYGVVEDLRGYLPRLLDVLKRGRTGCQSCGVRSEAEAS